MKISAAALDALKKSEGFRGEVYKDEAGIDTIGFGHLLTAADKASGQFNLCITEATASDLLQQDLAFAELAVTELVTVELKQNQFDALVDFVFNVGEPKFRKSSLLRFLNAGSFDRVPGELRRWNKVHVGGAVRESKGLTRRREREVAWWGR